ncbi:hypothetical protein HPB48_020952 [Haemaphysalis longicornis]|uniref:Kazal-like domain-containing protein n=1 Tax=Haemaphysalis longicornis TaxID=44386 RepID=A0A9J6FNV2_HAELO|nr:hypothetical protein HPB48_020952 [Haemaphysalis longicornis]
MRPVPGRSLRARARCESGVCVCPRDCPEGLEPVCDARGQPYANECQLRRASCQQGRDLGPARPCAGVGLDQDPDGGQRRRLRLPLRCPVRSERRLPL